MAALTFVQAAHTNGASLTALPFGSNTTGGSFLLAWIGIAPGGTVGSTVPTDTLLNTWLPLGSAQSVPGFTSKFQAYYVPQNNASGGANSVTFHNTITATSSWAVAEFTAQRGVSPLDQIVNVSLTATGSVQNVTSSPVPLASINEEVIVLMNDFSSSTGNPASAGIVAGTGYTVATGANGAAGGSGCIYGPFASGNQTPTATLTAAGGLFVGLAFSVFSASTPPAGGGGSGLQLAMDASTRLCGFRH